MLCEKCKVKEATTHIRRVINGVSSEHHFCAACAAQAGVDLKSPFSMGLNSLLGSVFGEVNRAQTPAMSDEVRCTGCGATYRDIARSGQVGCAQCYETFADQLMPTLQRIHGRTRHAGKLPSSAGERAKNLRQIDELQHKLSEAVEKQEYEEAARLRDEIRQLKESAGE